MWIWMLLIVAGLWAGAQNALAGGGSFVTLPTLILSGLGAPAANITSTIALFPGQVTTGLAGRGLVSGAERLSFRALLIISLAGGVLGAMLLLATPADFFARLVPWLVLFGDLGVRLGQLHTQALGQGRCVGAAPSGGRRSSRSPSMAAISAAASAF